MRPYYFGPDGERLFGVYDAPRHPGPDLDGVVVCHSWGHEYTNSQRVFRVLARRLASRDHHVLRFDYFGTGDSPAAADEICLSRLMADLEQAISELETGTGAGETSLIGLRLGASLGALVGARKREVDCMVLWEPVVQGDAYVEELRGLHARFLERSLPRSVRCSDAQILGHRFTARFERELGAIDLAALERRPAKRAMIMSRPAQIGAQNLADTLERLGCEVSYKELATEAFWASEVGVNQAVVPQEALVNILDFLEVPS